MAAIGAPAAGAVGGPVILGGDDLTDHGQTGAGPTFPSEEGWLYIEKAIANLKPKVGRANDNSIAAFGSSDPGAAPFSGGDAGGAIKNAAQKNGMTVRFFDGPAAIQAGFQEILAATYNPAIIWIAGDGATNDIDGCDSGDGPNDSEGGAITSRANVINAFVNGGGGLMSHGDCYTWLSALLPGLTSVNTGGSDDLYATPAGLAAFPGVTVQDFNAGPWHSFFEGNFGGLDLLIRSNAVDDASGQDAAVVIGGGQVSLTERPADLAVTKTAPATGQVGSNLTYTVTVRNNGANPATGVQVIDTIPGGLSARSARSTRGTCSGARTVTCSVGNLGVGEAATITIVIRPTAAATLVNSVRVQGNQPDPVAANNTATASTRVSRRPVRPRLAVLGFRGTGDSCVRASFRVRVNVSRTAVRRVVVKLDGRRVIRTTRARFSVRIRARSLKAGRHVVTIGARARNGTLTRSRRVFTRCPRAIRVAPRFTG